MVLLGLALIIAFMTWRNWTRLKKFDLMATIAAVTIAILVSVVAMGMMSFATHKEEVIRDVDRVITLSRGYAVATDDKTLYIQENIVDIVTGCEDLTVTERRQVTDRWILGFEVTVNTYYTICTGEVDSATG